MPNFVIQVGADRASTDVQPVAVVKDRRYVITRPHFTAAEVLAFPETRADDEAAWDGKDVAACPGIWFHVDVDALAAASPDGRYFLRAGYLWFLIHIVE